MNRTNDMQSIEDDVIDLRELLRIIKKYKKLIVTVTVLFILLALGYIYISKPLYQVKAMIEIGKLEAGTKDEKSLDNIADIKQKLEYIYGVKSKKARAYPKVRAIDINKQSRGVFTIVVEGHSNEKATSLVNNIVHKIEKEYQEKIDTYIHTKKELISLTRKDIETAKHSLEKIEETLKNYSQKIMNITAEDAALAGIYTIQISQNQAQAQSLHARISGLKARVYDKELSITPLRIKQTHIVGKIEVLDNPIKPNKRLIIIVSFIIGLIFSIFLVLFLEFLRGLKEETK